MAPGACQSISIINMDEKSLKTFRKWVKCCQKLGLVEAEMGQFKYSMAQPIGKASKLGGAPKIKGSGVEGLVHDPSAAMPSEGDLLFYSTDTYDIMQAGRKETKARNGI